MTNEQNTPNVVKYGPFSHVTEYSLSRICLAHHLFPSPSTM